tara:strand:+ start:61 stop:465 length:405 start_codon:yes stop_codon:yes gene_type:complete
MAYGKIKVDTLTYDSSGDVDVDVATLAQAIIPANARTAAYTLVAGDAGKVVSNTTGGWTIPASVFTTTGQTVTLLNKSGSAQNITASALTYLYNVADGANIKASTIALAARAMATIWFDGADTGYIQATKMTVS